MGKGKAVGWVTGAFLAIGTVFFFSSPDAFGADTFKVGARAAGMAGAVVATVNDGTAQYYNPAAFGFFSMRDESWEKMKTDSANLGRKDWGFELDGGFGYRLHNDLGELLDNLSDIDTGVLDDNGISSKSDLVKLVDLANILKRLDDPGNAVVADMNAGGGLRIKHFGIGVRSFFQASAQVLDIDTANLGISYSVDDLNTQITNAVAGDGQIDLFTTEQVVQLQNAGLTDAAIQDLDYAAREAGVTREHLQGTVDILADIADQSLNLTGGALEDNTTKALLRGFGWYEVPVTYGKALNDNVSVGINLKAMVGRNYATEVIIFNKDSGDIIKDVDKNYQETTTFGVDLGVMARLPKFQFGLVGRNLNSPKFDGPTVAGKKFSDITVDPQFTAGAAWIPRETMTLEVNYDLTKNETVLTGYDTQNFAVGAEWDAFRFLALRAGAFKNLAESDIGWVYTGGLGLNFYFMRLDIAGAMSDKTGRFDKEKIPIETRLTAQLSIDF